MRNFQILIVSAVKICKQRLQTTSFSGGVPRTPTGVSLLGSYPTGDFRTPGLLGYSRQMKVPDSATVDRDQ